MSYKTKNQSINEIFLKICAELIEIINFSFM